MPVSYHINGISIYDDYMLPNERVDMYMGTACPDGSQKQEADTHTNVFRTCFSPHNLTHPGINLPDEVSTSTIRVHTTM